MKAGRIAQSPRDRKFEIIIRFNVDASVSLAMARTGFARALREAKNRKREGHEFTRATQLCDVLRLQPLRCVVNPTVFSHR